MTDQYLMLGEAEPFNDDDGVSVQPRAGDVCRIRGEDDHWIPYGGVGNREEAGAFRFARFPSIDRVQTFDVADVCEIIIPAEDDLAREAWGKIESVLTLIESQGEHAFARHIFVFRAHAGRCATVAWNHDGRQVYSSLHPDMVEAKHRFDVFLCSVEEPVEITWCIGPDALRASIESGALSGVTLKDEGSP